MSCIPGLDYVCDLSVLVYVCGVCVPLRLTTDVYAAPIAWLACVDMHRCVCQIARVRR